MIARVNRRLLLTAPLLREADVPGGGAPCGHRPGRDRGRLDVRILDGVTGALPNLDGPPRPVVLRPGERATAVLAWRNTYNDAREPPVQVPFLEIAPAARPAQVLEPDGPLDLGSTGRIGVSPWSPA